MNIDTIKSAFQAVKEMPAPLPEADRRKLTVKDAKNGSYLRLGGAPYLVEEKSEYREGKWSWYELKLQPLLGGDVVFLEWEQDDKLTAALWEVGQARFGDLGITAADLDRFDDDERGQFTYNGTTYRYDESDQALWKQGCQGSGVPFYYYDFAAAGNKLLSVEKWDDGKYEVSLGTVVDPKKIEILSL